MVYYNYYLSTPNMCSCIFAILLLFVFCCCGPVEAADVSQTTGVLAYVIDTSCPDGWTDLAGDGTYRGRLIKGWNANTNLGSQSGTEISNNNMPGHRHPSWSRRLYFGDSQRTSCLNIFASPKMVDDGTEFFLTQSNSAMNDNHPRIQRMFCSLLSHMLEY